MDAASQDAEQSDPVTPYDLSDYAGCWVALVSDRVVATGTTARDALLNFRAHRLKDDPVVRWVPSADRANDLTKHQSGK